MTSRTWTIDPAHSNFQFIARHMVVAKVIGRFDRFGGSFEMDPENPASASINVEVETASVNTNAADRDTHLRSPDFLSVEEFPTMSFKSGDVLVNSPTHLTVHGELTLRGITKPVVLDVRRLGLLTDPWGQSRILFHARTTLNRIDFNISWNKALDNGGWLVSERVEIELDIQATSPKV